MILDALHAVTDVKILSNPSLVVIDNQVATLLVGDEIPVSTGTGNVLNSATGTNNTIVNSIDYRSTGIILRVIPRVSPNGNVNTGAGGTGDAVLGSGTTGAAGLLTVTSNAGNILWNPGFTIPAWPWAIRRCSPPAPSPFRPRMSRVPSAP